MKRLELIISLSRQCTNRALATLYVKDEARELAKVNTISFSFCSGKISSCLQARLLLYHMCRLSLKEGLELLGIEALTRI